MTELHNEILLSRNQPLITESSNEWYCLEEGSINVYVFPTVDGVRGKPELFCRITTEDRQKAVPGLYYEEDSRTCWQIGMVSEDGPARVTRFDQNPTVPTYAYFLQKAGLKGNKASFAKAMADFCKSKDRILISSTQPYRSENPTDAYRLEKGQVYLYIVPLENGKPGKRIHYCDLKDSDADRTVPAFCFKDSNHKNWRLLIESATEESELVLLPGGADETLRRQFLKRQDIATYDQEGFENSLVEFYTRQVVVKDKGFIIKSGKSEDSSKGKVVEVVKDTFSEMGQMAHTSSEAYQALQFVCRNLGIDLIKADELFIRCGKEPDLLDIARASHFICRKVTLDANWYESECGGLVGTLDEEPVALVPDKKGKYQLFRTSDESVTPLTPEVAKQISLHAYSIGRTLPLKPLTKKDVFRFCRKSIRPRDLVPYILLTVCCALIGVLLPTLNQMIYDDYIPVGNIGNLTQLCLVMLTFMVGNLAFSIVKNLFSHRITGTVASDLQNAVYHRLFHLRESFFRAYDSADLAERISSIGVMASRYANTLVISSLSALFSVFYLFRMFKYNGKLTWISLAIYLVYLLFITAITSTARKGQLRAAEARSESSGKLFQYLNGVDKIRMAGVEDRALLSYMQPYARQQYELIRVNRLVSVEEALTTVIKYIFNMVLYWYIVRKLNNSGLSVGSFVAFTSAFGSFTGALGSLVDEALTLFQEKSELDRVWDVFREVPEDDDTKEVPGPLSGGISLEHVTFAYDQTKTILNDLSLDIRPGEYIGIVGPSGCGKSTLLKLLLGFEDPQTGMVTVDSKDLRSINKGAYRRQLGVVLQNGKLISGSIHENITITCPDATLAQVKEVVKKVGLAEDIAQMPMGLNTMLSENSNTISGGQQQRILIARAICGSPKILIFDEATSALDNMTQKAVSESLDAMNVTRIVVAHRLSTIQNCNRIFVMDGGRIIQEGNYSKLMEDTNGLFYQLASRQIAQ